jgi:hypothetical protein
VEGCVEGRSRIRNIVESKNILISIGYFEYAIQHVELNLDYIISEARSFYLPAVFHLVVQRELYVVFRPEYIGVYRTR